MTADTPVIVDGNELPARHVIAEMYREHDQILALLDRLDGLINAYRDTVGTPDARTALSQIHAVAEDLCAADPHHAREEEVVFIELKRRGVHGPPECMEAEHEDLRALKAKIRDLSITPSLDTEELAESSRTLSDTLRMHIRKENEILYPMAVRAIDPATWSRLREAADRIGPCEFRSLQAVDAP